MYHYIKQYNHAVESFSETKTNKTSIIFLYIKHMDKIVIH